MRYFFLLALVVSYMAMNLTSCSYVTVIRTQELKNVEQNLARQIDSLNYTIDTMMKELRRSQNRTNADIRLIMSSMAKNNEAIKARLEETQYRLDKIDEKSDSILTKKPEPIIVPVVNPEADTVVKDSAKLESDKKLLERYEQARAEYNDKKYKQAYEGFKEVYINHSDRDVVESALFWLTGCFEESGKFDLAVKNYTKLFEEFPTGKKLCMAKLKLVHLADKMKNEDLKKETLSSLVNDAHCSGTSAAMQAEEMLK